MYFLRHTFRNADAGDAGGSAGNSSDGDGNNTGNDLTPWQIKSTMEGDEGEKRAAQDPPKTPASADDANAKFERLLDSFEFGRDINFREMSESLGNPGMGGEAGNMEEMFAKGFSQLGKNVFTTTMSQVGKVLETRIAAAVETAVARATGNVDQRTAMAEIGERLPFSTSKKLAPVTEAIVKGFMSQDGVDRGKAVALTEDFYKAVADDVGQHFGLKKPESSKPGAGGDSRNNNNDAPEEQDWLAMLTEGSASE